MSEPTPASRADLVGRILSYMDKPWKVFAIAFLAIIIGTGWVIWKEREQLIVILLPTPNHGAVLAPLPDLAAAARHLVGIEGTAMAQVWAFDIKGNATRFLTGINQDGTAWRPSDLRLPERLPVIVPGSDAQSLVTILRGDYVCRDTAGSEALLFERLAKAGIKRICIIPIPPTTGQVLAVFMLGWLDMPDHRMQTIAVDSAADYAGNLVSR